MQSTPKTHISLLLLLLLLLRLLLSFTITTVASLGPPPLQPFNTTPTPDNSTVYRATKALCFSCLSESLEFLLAHNLIRAAHLEFPLTWDLRLESYARWWADQRRVDCRLQHSFPDNGFELGENIFWGGGSGWTPTDAVGAWAGEEKYYRYESGTCEEGEMCGHYTQIVWRKTWRVGCARVVCDDGDVFMTCNYDPPGNYIGEKPY